LVARGDPVGYDLPLAFTALLVLLTAGVAVLYYRRIRRAQEGYEGAKEVVDDIIVSFNKQLERQEGAVHALTRQVESLSLGRGEVRRMEDVEGRLKEVAASVAKLSEGEGKVSEQLDRLNKKNEELASKQTELMQKMAEVEGAVRSAPVAPEASMEAAIPIKRERVLAPLTDTELEVLEILSQEGARTAPEIRERIRLSREHTARLMGKLYENGYVERDTSKKPYTYRIKEEMLKILKKTSEVGA